MYRFRSRPEPLAARRCQHTGLPLAGTGPACFLMLLLIASPAPAQVLLSPALQDPPQAEAEVPKPEPKVIKLHPAGEPDPALRYRFWPAIDQQRHASPHPFWSRANLLAAQALAQDRDHEFAALFEKIRALPLDQVANEETQQFLQRYGTAALQQLSEIDRLMDTNYDLQLEARSLTEMFELMLPEIQESRQLARLLQIRARVAIAEQRWDDAVNDIRVGFRLAEIVGDSAPLLVNKLTGFAIAGVMLGVVEEAIQQPDCPNLYWALASIPSEQVFEIRDALQFEVGNIARALRVEALDRRESLSTEIARNQLVTVVQQALQFAGPLDDHSDRDHDSDHVIARLLAGMYVVAMAEPSRELLSDSKDWSANGGDLSAAQAVALATQLRLRRTRDDGTKWHLLPPELKIDIEEKFNFGKQDLRAADVVTVLTGLLLPAQKAAVGAARRGVQQQYLWMTLEALRMHAAQSGELPQSLDDLQPVPALFDAISQTPFDYERTSPTTATLTHAPRWSSDTDNTLSIQLIVEESH